MRISDWSSDVCSSDLLGKYDPSFAAGWTKVSALLGSWKDGSGLWDHRAELRKSGVRLLGGIGAILGLIGLGVGGALSSRWGEEWLPPVVIGAVLAGAGFAAAIPGWEPRVRPPPGAGLWLRVEDRQGVVEGKSVYVS